MDKSSSHGNLPVLPHGYEYVKEISSGNYGIVWQLHNRNVNRYEAMKVLFRTGDIEYQRFCQEMETIATLNHPNIVTIYYAKPEELYFIMEYLEVSFHTLLKKRKITSFDGIRYLKQVASGLSFAHRKGLVHRDLKPANILFSSEMIPKITDFGLVKNIEFSDDITGSMSVGTPRYMAPEQWENSKITDHRCDIWALGIMLYEILAKESPFNNLSGFQLANAIMNQKIPPPSEVCSLSMWENLAEPICLKALERDPNKRYQSVQEMEKDLARLFQIDEETVSIPLSDPINPSSLAMTAVRSIHAKNDTPPWISRGAFFTLLLISTVVVSLWLYSVKNQQTQELEMQKQLQMLQVQLQNASDNYKNQQIRHAKELENKTTRIDELLQQQRSLMSKTNEQQHDSLEEREKLLSKVTVLQQEKLTMLNEHNRETTQLRQKLQELRDKYNDLADKNKILERKNDATVDASQYLQQIALLERQLQQQKSQMHDVEQKLLHAEAEIERLVRFENSLYKITLLGKGKTMKTARKVLNNKGFSLRSDVHVAREKNVCVYFTKKNPVPPELDNKVDYIIELFQKEIGLKLTKQKIEANNEMEIRLEFID